MWSLGLRGPGNTIPALEEDGSCDPSPDLWPSRLVLRGSEFPGGMASLASLPGWTLVEWWWGDQSFPYPDLTVAVSRYCKLLLGRAVRPLRTSTQARVSAVSPETKMVLFGLGRGEGVTAEASWPSLLDCACGGVGLSGSVTGGF